MSPQVLLSIVAFVLAAGSVGGVLLAAFYPRLAGGTPLERRIETIAASRGRTVRAVDGVGEKARKRSVEATLQDADERQKGKTQNSYRPSLTTRLRQANIGWTSRKFYLVCGVASIALFLAFLGMVGTLPAAGLAVIGGPLLPHLYVGLKRRRRLERFRTLFPDAIDVIVRGIKSGVPLGDCLKIVAAEAPDPVGAEFKTLVADQALGLPLGEAVQRLPDRIPVSEASFFAIVISVQSRTGGNLSEALGNLSGVLRERKKMLGKIAAMSAEAKASGGIIGSLPIVVGGILYFTSPAYIGLLFTTFTGNLVLAACAVWMMIGIFVMRQMINFDF
jgi:tight adherence protein B